MSVNNFKIRERKKKNKFIYSVNKKKTIIYLYNQIY